MRINVDFLDLRIFLTVFDVGHFHKAANFLNLSQPALSRRLRALETRLGTALFERSTRNVRPTPAGRLLEPKVRRLLDELESILPINGPGKRQSGQVTMSSIPSAAISFLPKIIKHFNQQFPLVRVRVLDRSPQEALECVMRGEAEFGINMIGSTETELMFTPVMDDPYILACRRDHPLAKKRKLSWYDLANHPLIRIGRENSGNRAHLDAALIRANVHLDWFYEVNNLTTSLGLVEEGLGATVLPRLAAPHRHQAAIVTKRLNGPEVTRTIGIIERRMGRLSPAAKQFRDLLLEDWKVLLKV